MIKRKEKEVKNLKIIRNSVVCCKCGTVLVSKNKHDVVVCGCGSVEISGGKRKLERNVENKNYIEKSLIEVGYGKKV